MKDVTLSWPSKGVVTTPARYEIGHLKHCLYRQCFTLFTGILMLLMVEGLKKFAISRRNVDEEEAGVG